VAHDLREPLRTISMLTEILARKTELGAEGKELAQNIVDGVKRVTTLFDGLRALALSRSGSRQNVDMSRIVAEVLRDIGHAVTISGATVTADRLPFVRSRENDLSRVFQNLIMNAIKYRGDAAPRIHIGAEAAGDEWIVSVRDNGVGIPAEHRERVFIPFQRLHGRSTPGVGIGLSICRKIVESTGGRIWVTDSVGNGATLRFTVPAVNEDPHRLNGNQRPAAPEAARAEGA
jgi:signal transduction histidine kinase